MAHPLKSITNTQYDIVIVGGGMVGASMALALSPLPLKIALVDGFVFGNNSQPSYDDRSVALSYGSRLIFQGMGLWEQLSKYASPINHIHVSDQGHLGIARLDCKQEKLPALGYTIESRLLGQQIYLALQQTNIDIIAPWQVTDIKQSPDISHLTLSHKNTENAESINLATQLLIAADGTHSTIRELSGISSTHRPYQQSAIIANVSTDHYRNGQAYERFTPSGPLALLPLTQERYSLVWTHTTESVDGTMSLDDAAFMESLQKTFGYRLGLFTRVGKRSHFPLTLSYATQNVSHRTVLIGNASHTLHPVAGQGLNLGLRDIATLAGLIAQHTHTSDNPLATVDFLQHYESQRHPDHQTVIRYTDLLISLFSNDDFLLGHARSTGLIALDRIAPIRKLLTQQSMGIRHRHSRLSRGLPLAPYSQTQQSP